MQGWSSRHHFDDLLTKVDNHLACWKTRVLSFTKRVTLAKTILSMLPNNLMQSVYFSKSECDEFDKRVRRFIWRKKNGGQCVHLVN